MELAAGTVTVGLLPSVACNLLSAAESNMVAALAAVGQVELEAVAELLVVVEPAGAGLVLQLLGLPLVGSCCC